MTLPPIKLSARRPALLDAASDGYVQWRLKCVVVRDTYRAWTCAAAAYEPPRFAAYLAALDREEKTAKVVVGPRSADLWRCAPPGRRAALSATNPWARNRPDVDVIRHYSTGA